MFPGGRLAGWGEGGPDFFFGARERTDTLVRTVVLNDETPLAPLFIEREQGETQLFVKEVKAGGRRYIVCRNEAEAEKDRKEPEGNITELEGEVEGRRKGPYRPFRRTPPFGEKQGRQRQTRP